MHLHDLLGWESPMTWRQFCAWEEWLALQWNVPSRTDHYLMQVSTSVHQAASKRPRSIKMEHFRLKFEPKRAKKKPSSLDPRTLQMIKARWIASMGTPVEVVNPES